jgi:hypothetical protein
VEGTPSLFTVAKLSGFDANVLWQTNLSGSDPDSKGGYAAAIALDAAGDPIAVGWILSPDWVRDLTVTKVSGLDGTVQWRVQFGAPLYALEITADMNGDVLMTAQSPVSYPTVEGYRTAVCDAFAVKLSGLDGSEIWRRELPGDPEGCETPQGLAIDGGGDVYLAVNVRTEKQLGGSGATENTHTASVLKLAGEDGSSLWDQAIVGTLDSPHDILHGLALGPAGNLAVAGSTQNLGTGSDFTVLTLSTSDGKELWRSIINGRYTTNPGDEPATQVAFDSTGDLLAAGVLEQRVGHAGVLSSADRVVVAKFSGDDGAEIWRHVAIGPNPIMRFWPHRTRSEASGLLVDSEDNAVVGGRILRHAPQFGDWTVLKLRGEEGGDLRPVEGTRVFLRDEAVDPSRRVFRVLSGDGRAVLGDRLAGGLNGRALSNPVLNGATLEILNPITGESDVIPLPASNWEDLGGNDISGMKGFRYRDPARSAGPCVDVWIRTPRRIKVICSGDGIGFTLDEATQGTLVVRLRVAATQYCMEFGGETVRDQGASANRPRGVFKATRAHRSASCPFSPP